jgi:hypothetical protein
VTGVLTAGYVRRGAVSAVLAFDACGFLGSLAELRRTPAVYPDGIVWSIVPLWGVALAFGLVTSRKHAPRGAVAIFAAVSVGALALHPWIYSPTSGSTAYPPLFHGAVLGITGATILLPIRAAVSLAACYGVWVGVLRAPITNEAQAVIEAVIFTNGALVPAWGMRLLDRAAGDVERRARRAAAAREELMRSQRLSAQQEQWRSHVHDKVLGALRLVAREEGPKIPAEAKSMARDGARVLVGLIGASPAGSPGTQLRAFCSDLGLTAQIDVSGEVGDAVVQMSLLGAAREALTNVARHAHTSRVDIHGCLGPERARLIIQDEGVGFDLNSMPTDRLGVTEGIQQRMSRVHGQGKVSSQPGVGTTVELNWARSRKEDRGLNWRESLFLPATGFATVATLAQVAMGAVFVNAFSRSDVVVLAMILAPLSTAALALAPKRWRAVHAVALAVVILTPPVLAWHLTSPTESDWRFWFCGVFDAALAALSFRRHWATGIGVCFLLMALVLAAQWHQGRPEPTLVFTAFLAPLAAATFAALGRIALTQATSAVNTHDWDHERATAAVWDARERLLRTHRRFEALHDAVARTLAEIEGGQDLQNDLRDRCRQLEAGLRDRLLSGDLIDDVLAGRIAQARGRGVLVEAGAVGEIDQYADPFRQVAGLVLARAQTGDTVHIRWRPCGREVGHVTFVGPWRARGVRIEDFDGTAEGIHAEVTTDEGSMIIELAH